MLVELVTLNWSCDELVVLQGCSPPPADRMGSNPLEIRQIQHTKLKISFTTKNVNFFFSNVQLIYIRTILFTTFIRTIIHFCPQNLRQDHFFNKANKKFHIDATLILLHTTRDLSQMEYSSSSAQMLICRLYLA